jgi:ribonuclease HII
VSASQGTQQPEPEWAGRRFEYRLVEVTPTQTDATAELTMLGAAGWQAVCSLGDAGCTHSVLLMREFAADPASIAAADSPTRRPATRFPSLLAHDLATGLRLVAGADEVGRACLAGPLVAAACLFEWEALDPADRDRLAGLRDSKTLSPARCRELRPVIEDLAVDVAVCVVTSVEVDRDGLEVSNLRALRDVVSKLTPQPQACFTDGFAVPASCGETTKLVRGDDTSAAVAAASVIAKAVRDELMAEIAVRYPGYGFERNQGYNTPEHAEALRRLKVITPEHRRSFDAKIYRELGLHPAAG